MTVLFEPPPDGRCSGSVSARSGRVESGRAHPFLETVAAMIPILSSPMARVTAGIGRCDVCALEPAAWSGDGVRLCEACYRRESRRRLRRGRP